MLRVRSYRARWLPVSLALGLGCYVPEPPEPPGMSEPGASDAEVHGRDAPPADMLEGPPSEELPPARPHHAACRFPAPELPIASWPRVDSDGRPLLDAWRALSCEAAETLHACDQATPCPFVGSCLRLSPGLPGICVPRAECTVGVPLSYREGACSVCVPLTTKAALCCVGAANVDCRAWPFVVASRPGEPCFDRMDCEPGLECAGTDENSYPTCVCPGVTAAAVERPLDCYDAQELEGSDEPHVLDVGDAADPFHP